MSNSEDLAEFLDRMVARAIDDEAPARSESAVTQPTARRNLAYRAARKAYRAAMRPQTHVNDALRADVTNLQAEHAALRVDVAVAQAAIASLELAVTRLADIGERLSEALTRLGGQPESATAERLDRMYADFEDEFRGSFEMISERLRVYVDTLWNHPQHGGPVLDIGCGRGEWLSLLAKHRIEAYGVDLSPEFVEGCRALGLDARLADAFTHLPTVPTGTLGTVTAFQIVEHLPVARLVELVDEASRVLRPGGLLILETPNPTNLSVGAAAFYRDPTHQRPVHPEFLGFLVRHCGFIDVEIRYLHPTDPATAAVGAVGELGELSEDARWALRGPQDYAVVASKPAG